MSLVACPECAREISDKALSCPGCGFPLTPCSGIDDTNKGFNVVKFVESHNIRGSSEILRVANEFHYLRPTDLLKAKKLYEYIVSEYNGENAETARLELAKLGDYNTDTDPTQTKFDHSNMNEEFVIFDIMAGVILGAVLFYLFGFADLSYKYYLTPLVLVGCGMYLRFTFKRNKAVFSGIAGMLSGFFIPLGYILLK